MGVERRKMKRKMTRKRDKADSVQLRPTEMKGQVNKKQRKKEIIRSVVGRFLEPFGGRVGRKASMHRGSERMSEKMGEGTSEGVSRGNGGRECSRVVEMIEKDAVRAVLMVAVMTIVKAEVVPAMLVMFVAVTVAVRGCLGVDVDRCVDRGI